MPIIMFVYQCPNKFCGHTEKYPVLKQDQITCPKCCSTMNFVGIEKENEDTK
jgi:hypothetical protein